MTFRQLEMFSAIVESHGFLKAAERLHVAQPSISQQMRFLEEELGERLLIRSRNRKIQLTEAGKVLKRHSDHVLRQIEFLRMEISALSTDPAGQFHIGIGGHQLTSMLAPALRAFHAKFPKIRLDIVNGTTPQIVDLIRENRLDLGIVTFPLTVTDLRKEELFHESMMLVVGRTHPLAKKREVSPAELAGLPLALYDLTTSTRARLDAFFRENNIQPEIMFEMSSVEAMQMMVETGVGATIIPASALLGGQHRQRLRGVRIKGNPITREVGAAMPPFSRLPRVAEELLALIRNRFQKFGRHFPSNSFRGRS